jgi:hypothetical protein
MKTLKHTVDLVFFQDDASGEWGVTHRETYDHPSGDSFNAFWDGRGLFHDVFEHSQERKHPYFTDEAARMNVGGEMWAMGALSYYLWGLNVTDRLGNRGSIYSNDQQVMEVTKSLVYEAMKEGYSNFGSELVSRVPHQKPVDNYSFESMLNEYDYCLKQDKAKARRDRIAGRSRTHYEKSQEEYGRDYAKSVNMSKIRNLHRGGWYWAQDLVPDDIHNRTVMEDFISFWEKFCQANKAEELSRYYKYLTIEIFHEEKADRKTAVSWRATLVPDVGAEYSEDGEAYARVVETVIESWNLPLKDDGEFNPYHTPKVDQLMLEEMKHA